jgi:hypothetical protein
MDWSLSGFSKQVTRVLAPWAVAASALVFGGCAGNNSGNVPFAVLNQSSENAIAQAVDLMPPGFASIKSTPDTTLTGVISAVVSNNSTANNRYVDFLYYNADGTWRRDSVYALTGDHANGSPQMNYQPTQREVVQYVMAQEGTEAKVMKEGQDGVLQAFKRVDTIFVRNRLLPALPPMIVEITPFDNNIESIRLATDQEMLQAQSRPNYSRLPGPYDRTWVKNYDPYEYVYNQKNLKRANMNAGSPNSLPQPHRNRINPGNQGR